MLELQLGLARRARDLQRLRAGQRGASLDELHLPQLRDAADAGGQLVDDALLVGAQLVDVDRRLAEGDAPVAGVLRLVDHLGDVQQRLRRNAAAIEADAAGVLLLVDERDLHAEVGGIEGRGISARACAEYRNLSRIRAISRPVTEGRVARSLRRPSAGTASRRRHRSRGDRRRATAAASAAARNAPSFQTGSVAPRETPRIATSGQLTIGVK